MDAVKTSPRFGFRCLATGLAVPFNVACEQIIETLKNDHMVEAVPSDLQWDDSWTEYLNTVYTTSTNIDVVDGILMRAFFAALNNGKNDAASEILKMGIINRLIIGQLYSVYILPSVN